MAYLGFKRVLSRELKTMFGRPIYMFSTIIVMAFSCIFFLSLLKEGLPNRLPIAIVDKDQSGLSRRFCRELNATSGVKVEMKCTSFQEAREEMQKGNIYGFILVPENFYKNMLANRRPSVTFYVNNSYLIAGNLVYRDLLTMSNLSSAAYQQEYLKARGFGENQIMGQIQPIVIDSHQIGNQHVNYAVYLANVALPAILQLMILLLTVFAIGIELKTKTSREWLREADGSLAVALAGKLTPYTILFSIIGISVNILLYRFVGFPFHGSLTFMCIVTILYVIAHQAIGIFMIGMFPVLRDGISMASLYGILSFSFAGFTFPIEAMPRIVQGLSNLFPIRHYFKIYVNEALLGVGIGHSLLYLAVLLLFTLLPYIVYKRLKSALIYQNYPLK